MGFSTTNVVEKIVGAGLGPVRLPFPGKTPRAATVAAPTIFRIAEGGKQKAEGRKRKAVGVLSAFRFPL